LRLLGTLCLDEGQIPEAREALEHALALAPEDAIASYSLGLVRLKEKRPADALPLLERSLAAADPIQRNLKIGALLTEYGAKREALRQFERAASDDPSSYDALYDVAVLRLALKDADGAGKAAERAVGVNSSAEAHN